MEREHIPIGLSLVLVGLGTPLALLSVTPGWSAGSAVMLVRASLGLSGVAMVLIASFDDIAMRAARWLRISF